MSKKSAFFFTSGKPGAGKSTKMSSSTRILPRCYGFTPGLPVAKDELLYYVTSLRVGNIRINKRS